HADNHTGAEADVRAARPGGLWQCQDRHERELQVLPARATRVVSFCLVPAASRLCLCRGHCGARRLWLLRLLTRDACRARRCVPGSRFGKLISVTYDGHGRMKSAKISSYLLEKTRVVKIPQGERSFHIL